MLGAGGVVIVLITDGVHVSEILAPSTTTVWPANTPPLPDVDRLAPAGLKNLAIPSFCSSVVAFSNQSSRKNAIIAVTKSA